MVAIPSRHRSLILLAVVLAAQVLLLAAQIQRDRKGRLLRVWTVSALSPFGRAGAWSSGKVRKTWNHYFALRKAATENDALRRELGELQQQVSQLRGRAAEADRLAALLDFRQAHPGVPMLTARVIGASADPASLTFYIDRGERDGVRRNMAVITPDGVVGKVIEAFGRDSQVLLLTDKESGVGAMLADSRLQSPASGTGEPLLTMKYVGNDETVNIGARVVTSGMDRIFPKDLPVGTVAEVKPGTPFKHIRIRPSARLDRLEEVLVLLTLRPLELKKEPQTAAAPAAVAEAPAPKP